ncbi:MAG TPA: squalene/phytoene synthase family protein, partial [Terriglobales bacterium]|nr:squalene/phytoene synthase family protein [Terriglobales bacterium]
LMDLPEEPPTEPEARPRTSEKLAGPVVQYRAFKDLYLYCYHVASVVGLVCIKIFGYRDQAAEHLAERCGIAFQLTNIIRDVKEDAMMGRVYLPLEDLQRFELTLADLESRPDVSRLRALLAVEADRARDFYKSGFDLIPLVNEDSQPALWVLVTIYQKLLEKIAQRQYDVYGSRIRLTTFEKLSVLGKGFIKRIT